MSSTISRLRVAIRGAVQGVGFRPFVHRLAGGLGLTGWVNNSPAGVSLEVEGPRQALENFLLRLETEKPPHSFIQSLEALWLDAVGYTTFEIRPSDTVGPRRALVLPDIATCSDCLTEIFAEGNRRYRYPFTNCTHCGPRFSIIEALPYDRANTTMGQFPLCPECRAEFENPLDRRFHAQPNACPVCGPQLAWWNQHGNPLQRGDAALLAATKVIQQGQIVALKGLGGFQLITSALDDAVVRRLRALKHREEKPLAVMFPTLETIRMACEISPLEERLLRSPEAPIVLLRRVGATPDLAAAIAPGNPFLGVLLPYTPLHHLLMAELRIPVIATSGNVSSEPICIDETDALHRLAGIADFFLVHNRPIVRAVDDSVARIILGREQVLRRARGYAPLPVMLGADKMASTPLPSSPRVCAGEETGTNPGSNTILAVGAHLKNTVALGIRREVFISQHLGDLENAPSFEAFVRAQADLQTLFEAQPAIIAADAHPDYLSTKFAAELRERNPALRLVSVQHHEAHILACMAENELEPPVLGVSWDGTGWGPDGTIWGGEFLLVTDAAVQRVAHLRTFPLPGGEKAIREPRRIALGLLHEVFGANIPAELTAGLDFSSVERAMLTAMLEKKLNSPRTSSIGRLFDGVAALAGLRQKVSFEGQAAMEWEFALDGVETEEAYPLDILSPCQNKSVGIGSATVSVAVAGVSPATLSPFAPALQRKEMESERIFGETPKTAVETTALPIYTGSGQPPGPPLILDWQPLIKGILSDLRDGVPKSVISAKFHNALVEAIIAVARRCGGKQVALSGGCFQNRYLTERVVQRLQQEGFRPHWHQRVPPNDGGIAFGQILAVRRAVP